MTELLVGTKKGLFVLEGEPGGAFAVRARAFAGEPVEYAMRDPRSGRVIATRDLAASTARRSGTPTIRRASGSRPTASRCPRAATPALERIWVIVAGEADGTLYAGGDPGVLFESRDGGATLGAQPLAVGAPDAAGLAAGRRRAVPALDRAVAGRSRPAGARRCRRSACG